MIGETKFQKLNRLRRQSRLRRLSKGLAAELRKYNRISKQFLSLPENRLCVCCLIRREKLGENIVQREATEVHHWAGRIGRLLCYVPYFRPFCFWCREWPHQNVSLARKLGLLAPAPKWNVYPE